MRPPTAESAKVDQICLLPTSTWIKIRGNIPSIVVLVVRKMGLTLSLAPCKTASKRGIPCFLLRLIWSTRRIELLTTIPPSRMTPI